ARVEGLCRDELLEVLTRADEALVGEVHRLAGLDEDVLAALADREVVPVVRGRPLVTGADRDRLDARALERVDGGVEVVHGLGGLGDPGLLEEVGVVPEADDADRERQGVGLALVLPAGYRRTDLL